MARQTFKIEGLRQCDRALAELPKAVARNVVIRVLTEQGKPIERAGAALAPRLTGHLADSYTTTTKLSRRQKNLNDRESDVEVYIGPGPAPESVQTEFGNAHQAAEPHLRPAFDGNVMQVLNGITEAFAAEIEKARARLAKQADGLIARIRAGRNAAG